MDYDQRAARTLLFGGWTNSRHADTWAYAGTQSLTVNPSTVSIAAGGTQTFTLNAGTQHGTRLYWIFGSVTGTTPGVNLGSAIGTVNIPLNPDIWTDIMITQANTLTLVNTKATLDASGKAKAAFRIPPFNIPSAIGLVFYHAYLVYDANNNFYMASNPVPLKLVK